MIGYHNNECLRRAEEYFRDFDEVIPFSKIERIADEQFEGEDPRFMHNKRHLKFFKKIYVTKTIIPFIEQKLKENSNKRFTLAQIISEFDIPEDWKPNIINYLHAHIKQRDNDLIMISPISGVGPMSYQYEPECAEAMRAGRSQGKWLCYENMCTNGDCRKLPKIK